jgi:hypothetical protein
MQLALRSSEASPGLEPRGRAAMLSLFRWRLRRQRLRRKHQGPASSLEKAG